MEVFIKFIRQIKEESGGGDTILPLHYHLVQGTAEHFPPIQVLAWHVQPLREWCASTRASG